MFISNNIHFLTCSGANRMPNDAGASSVSTHGKTTQRLRTNLESRMLANTANILQLIETEKGKSMRIEKLSTHDLGV
jgi:hypothetical protein